LLFQAFEVCHLLATLLKNGVLRALTLLFLFASTLLSAQEFGFIPNQGQWEGDFDFRLRQGSNFVFVKAGEQRVLLLTPPGTDHNPHQHPQASIPNKGHVYRLRWIGANPASRPKNAKMLAGVPYLNFLQGKESRAWQSGVKQYQEFIYPNIYPGVDLRYYLSDENFLKYDFIVHPGADPSQIKWQIEGVEEQGLAGSNIALLSSVGSLVYTKPEAFQGEQEIDCYFQKAGNGEYSFSLGEYDQEKVLIIDPTLIFSTYSGSTDDNFGLSATFGEEDMAYGAGVNFFSGSKQGFPTTLGAFQDSSIGSVDISIAKYTADGSAQVYATYLGGKEEDVPFSLLEGPNKSLIILGMTGSPDFPVSTTAYDTTFAFGPGGFHRVASGFQLTYASDMFLSILDSTGGNLLGSTYLGDSLKDAVNNRMDFNYGDGARGDITIDQNGNIIVSSFTESPNLPSGGSNTSYGGLQDGLVVSFNSDLSQLNWLSYVGGESNDAVFSLRYTANNRLFITGATESDSISTDTVGVLQPFRAGKVDAFVAELDPANGQIMRFTYNGTQEDDLAYFLDLDPEGDLVLFGQTYGAWPIVGDSVWGQYGSAQFLQEINPGLNAINHSTTFGDGQVGLVQLSPTALLVSDCGDIFISGWGAAYPSARGLMTVPRNMPLTHDALRSTVDFGDFYFLRLDASWQRLEYATYFGQVGFGPDHVDGGSSRFRKDGNIFQAVCSCGSNNQGFPTTPNAFADTKGSSNCNMAVFRIDMEADTVRADVRLGAGLSDTLCLPDSVSFQDFSFNADLVLFRIGDGLVDTLDDRYFQILDSGTTTFHFIALDTNCLLVDSMSLSIYAKNDVLDADFEIEYDSCDATGLVKFRNLSSGASHFRWYFQAGDTSVVKNPQRNFSPDEYEVQLIAEDRICSGFDTVVKKINIRELEDFTRFETYWDPCDPERNLRLQVFQKGFHQFNWTLDGNTLPEGSDTLSLQLNDGGFHTIQLEIVDTVCGRTKTYEEELYFYDEDFSINFPNVFSPNGDQLNDEFRVLDAERLEPILEKAEFEIYNRNGLLLFKGNFLKDAWDGKSQGQDLPPGVYFYVFNYEDICGQKSSDKGFVHLQR